MKKPNFLIVAGILMGHMTFAVSAFAHCPDSSGSPVANQRPVVVESANAVSTMKWYLGDDHIEKSADGSCSASFKTSPDNSFSSVSIAVAGDKPVTFMVTHATAFLFTGCLNNGALENDFDLLYGSETAIDPAHPEDSFWVEQMSASQSRYTIVMAGKQAIQCTVTF